MGMRKYEIPCLNHGMLEGNLNALTVGSIKTTFRKINSSFSDVYENGKHVGIRDDVQNRYYYDEDQKVNRFFSVDLPKWVLD